MRVYVLQELMSMRRTTWWRSRVSWTLLYAGAMALWLVIAIPRIYVDVDAGSAAPDSSNISCRACQMTNGLSATLPVAVTLQVALIPVAFFTLHPYEAPCTVEAFCATPSRAPPAFA